MLLDIAGMVFVCVTMNHLGLITAIEETAGTRLPVINCPKCSSYWCVLFYMLFATGEIIPSFAISFLASYTAIWLELFEGMIDKLYDMLYDKIYPTND